jgi:hypothetical protein
MSGKQAKKVRKQINNLIKQRSMQNNDQVQFSFKQLETYVQLSQFLTGRKPDTIELVDAFYNWYVQEVNNQAEAMGLKPGFKDDKVTFLGIPLTKKVTIATPKN